MISSSRNMCRHKETRAEKGLCYLVLGSTELRQFVGNTSKAR